MPPDLPELPELLHRWSDRAGIPSRHRNTEIKRRLGLRGGRRTRAAVACWFRARWVFPRGRAAEELIDILNLSDEEELLFSRVGRRGPSREERLSV